MPMSFAKAAAHPPVASAEIVHTHATSTTFDKNGKVVKVVEEEENIDIAPLEISFAQIAKHTPARTAEIADVPARTETFVVTPEYSYASAAHANQMGSKPSEEVYVPAISKTYDSNGEVAAVDARNIKLDREYASEELVAIVDEVCHIQKLVPTGVVEVKPDSIVVGQAEVVVGKLVEPVKVEKRTKIVEPSSKLSANIADIAKVEAEKPAQVSSRTEPSVHKDKLASPAQAIEKIQHKVEEQTSKKKVEKQRAETKAKIDESIEKLEEGASKALDSAGRVAENVKSEVLDTASKVKDTVSDVTDKTTTKAKEVVSEVLDTASKVKDTVSDVTDKTTTKAKEVVSEVKKAKAKAEDFIEAAQDQAGDIRSELVDAVNFTASKLSEAKDVAEQTVADWKTPVNDFKNAIIETGKQGAYDVSEASSHVVQDVLQQSQKKASELVQAGKNDATKLVESSKESITHMVDNTVETANHYRNAASELVDSGREAASNMLARSQSIVSASGEFGQAVYETGEVVLDDLKTVGAQVRSRVASRGSAELNKGIEAYQHMVQEVEERAKQIKEDLLEEAENARRAAFAATQSVAQAAIGSAVYAEEKAEGIAIGTANLAREVVVGAAQLMLDSAVGASKLAYETATSASHKAVDTTQQTYSSLRSGVKSASNSALNLAHGAYDVAEQVKDVFEDYTQTSVSIESADSAQKLTELVSVMSTMKTCMLTTNHNNELYSRAGYIVPSDLDNLYIFSVKGPHPASDALHIVDRKVNVSLQNASTGEWVSIAGEGFPVDSEEVCQKHWSSDVKTFFGPSLSSVKEYDDRLELILVKISQVSYSVRTPVVRTPVGLISSVYNGMTSLVTSKQVAMSVRELNQSELLHARLAGIEE